METESQAEITACRDQVRGEEKTKQKKPEQCNGLYTLRAGDICKVLLWGQCCMKKN